MHVPFHWGSTQSFSGLWSYNKRERKSNKYLSNNTLYVGSLASCRPITVYQGKIYDRGEKGYAMTGIVDFPQGNSVFVCVVVLRPRLTSMVNSGRLTFPGQA